LVNGLHAHLSGISETSSQAKVDPMLDGLATDARNITIAASSSF